MLPSKYLYSNYKYFTAVQCTQSFLSRSTLLLQDSVHGDQRERPAPPPPPHLHLLLPYNTTNIQI